ncbi:MAG: MotA/TolQ/ExbB proton channel family protein [Myxococcales bacterium]|nr:MotA/TolQ/ExbB proton channel family protein [Myxococcales bacterium]
MLRAGSRWVLWLMLGLSLAAITVIIERVWFFVSERPPRQLLADALARLRTGGPAAALAMLKGARSMEAEVARRCLAGAADGVAAVESLKAAAIEEERLRYERRTAFLGTLGNNAPFVGLFGTVLGIIRAFHDLSATAAQDTQAVMGGIGEALVATGVGLLVALPAVATYNIFVRRVETSVGSSEALAHQILAYLKIERPAPAASTSAEA